MKLTDKLKDVIITSEANKLPKDIFIMFSSREEFIEFDAMVNNLFENGSITYGTFENKIPKREIKIRHMGHGGFNFFWSPYESYVFVPAIPSGKPCSVVLYKDICDKTLISMVSFQKENFCLLPPPSVDEMIQKSKE